MEKIKVEYVDQTYIKVRAEPGIAYELNDYFTFKVPGYQFSPKYRAGFWNGNISLYSRKTGKTYYGLLEEIKLFAEARGYELDIAPELELQDSFSVLEAKEFVNRVGLPSKLEVRDYQLKYFISCVQERRLLCISPTASGKSLIIYLLALWYVAKGHKLLIIVDTINLLNQMFSDFKDYGFDSDKYIHKISGGKDKNSKKPIFVSTWQSATKMDSEWLDQFGAIIIDEAHRAKATSVKKILENMPNCKFRFGFTGTLDGTETNKLVLTGLIGRVQQYTTTKELIEQGYNAELKLKILQLVYSDEEKKACKSLSYAEEIDFIYAHPKRNELIKNLALSLKGNTLVTFHRVDSHGVPLFNKINSEADVPVYYVSGKVDGDEREEIRKIVQTHKNSIIVASSRCFSTGVNIPNLDNIIVTNPSKSLVQVLQTIGRGLRKTELKNSVTVFDIVDDLSWKKNINFTLKHFVERIKIYAENEFIYKIFKIELK